MTFGKILLQRNLYFLLVGLFVTGCRVKTTLTLSSSHYLVISDSLIITLDSLTYPYSKNIHFKDSILFIQNEGTNTVSLYSLSGKKICVYDFGRLKDVNKNFKINAAWFISPDTILVYSSTTNYTYLFDHTLKIIDSIEMPNNENLDNQMKTPLPYISTAQLPIFNKGELYTTGYSIGEREVIDEKKSFVVAKADKNEIRYFVNYPLEYSGKDWGGIYYRMVYNCTIGDSIMCISFPASSSIALFNIRDKSVNYQSTFPDISQYIQPYGEKVKPGFNKLKIAEHFYGQYSFRGIIFDKYRNLFYRFLLKPTGKEYLKKDHMGPQGKYLLVYDSHFKYLGYTELDKTFSHFSYFVTQKGLYIQRLKNSADEDHICFSIFTVNSINQLQTQ